MWITIVSPLCEGRWGVHFLWVQRFWCVFLLFFAVKYCLMCQTKSCYTMETVNNWDIFAFPSKKCDTDTIKITRNINLHFINRFTSLQLCSGNPFVVPILIGMSWHHFKWITAVQSQEIRKLLKLCKIAQVSYFMHFMWLYNFKQIQHYGIIY